MQQKQETRVPLLGWEDALEWEVATHSRILAGKIPWTEEPGGLQSMGSQRVRDENSHIRVYPRLSEHHAWERCSPGG